jgi:hypothetical protein
MSMEDIAVSRMSFGLAQPSAGEAEDAARISAGIDATMREVIASARHNPNRIDAPAKVGVAGAVLVVAGAPLAGRGTGWAEPRPMAGPPGQEAIERLVKAALPHGPGSKAGQGPGDV